MTINMSDLIFQYATARGKMKELQDRLKSGEELSKTYLIMFLEKALKETEYKEVKG